MKKINRDEFNMHYVNNYVFVTILNLLDELVDKVNELEDKLNKK